MGRDSPTGAVTLHSGCAVSLLDGADNSVACPDRPHGTYPGVTTSPGESIIRFGDRAHAAPRWTRFALTIRDRYALSGGLRCKRSLPGAPRWDAVVRRAR
ncbi:hypothetical protein GCM10022380_82310 [Amycolatopsis tucumanensis]|uniref:Uncharacterized protein n=1 Tax=Amycolatopsis tucumanensis TaxID=401106 RepID=A0ABP7JS77_9PSEU